MAVADNQDITQLFRHCTIGSIRIDEAPEAQEALPAQFIELSFACRCRHAQFYPIQSTRNGLSVANYRQCVGHCDPGVPVDRIRDAHALLPVSLPPDLYR